MAAQFLPAQDAEQSVFLAWDSLGDLERLTGEPLPIPPWHVTSDGQIEDGPRLQGILWSQTTEYQAAELSALPHDSWNRSFDEMASSYRAADFRMGTDSGAEGYLPPFMDTCFPDCPPWQVMPWDVCPMCGLGIEMPWLWAVDDVVLAVTPTRQLNVTDRVSSVRWYLFGGGLRVLASESESMLRSLDIPQREVVIDPDTLDVVTTIGLHNGTLAPMERVVDGPVRMSSVGTSSQDPCGGDDFATVASTVGADTRLAYSAVHDTLMALSRPVGCARARLGLRKRRAWRELDLDAPVAEPVSIAFHLGQHALFVIEREDGRTRPLHLARIDLQSGHVERLGKVAVGREARAALTVLPDGDLVVAVSRERPSHVRFARLRTTHNGVQRTAWLLVPNQLLVLGLAGRVRHGPDDACTHGEVRPPRCDHRGDLRSLLLVR